MADTDMMMPSDQNSGSSRDEARPTDGASHADHVVGVRLRDSARVSFFNVDDPDITVGTWVMVPTSHGEQPARVVIAPRQVVLSGLRGTLASVIRLLGPDSGERNADLRASSETDVAAGTMRANGGSRLIGALGKSGRALKGFSPALIDLDLSCENARYRKAKQHLPPLGQRVNTEAGEGIVVSVQVFKDLVTVRYDDPAREVTYPAADLLPDR